MNDLYLALGILAVFLLLAIWVYSKWQERRALRRIQESVRGSVGDALLNPKRAMPHSVQDGRIEPTLGTPADSPTSDARSFPTEPKVVPSAWVEDPFVDCGLELHCSHAVDGVAVIDAAAPLARLGLSLPVHLVALDGRSQQWVEPDRFGFYTVLLAAVQLADRRKVLDEINASRFISAVQHLAVALEADFDPPDAPRILALANELDQLCARFDVRIGLTMVPESEAWKLDRVGECAGRAGLSNVSPPAWHCIGAKGQAVFAVTAAGTPVERLQFELDVPSVAPSERPLRRMFEAATQMAADLGARIVDDNGKPVLPASIDAIEAQLDSLYAEMATAGIEAGSVRARRLYS
jgi:hypothetical protein